MIKKVILPGILIGLIGGGAAIYFTTKNSATVSTTLSERSKAFLAEQQKDTTSDLKYARIGKEDTAGAFVGKKVDVGNCFSFVMLFRVSNPREDGPCNWYFGIEQPKGFMTAYMQKAEGISSVNDVDGVSMRQQFPDKYTKRQEVISGVTYLIFKGRDPQQYESSAFAYLPNKSSALIFNLIIPSPDSYDKEFEAMLRSIQVN